MSTDQQHFDAAVNFRLIMTRPSDVSARARRSPRSAKLSMTIAVKLCGNSSARFCPKSIHCIRSSTAAFGPML